MKPGGMPVVGDYSSSEDAAARGQTAGRQVAQSQSRDYIA